MSTGGNRAEPRSAISSHIVPSDATMPHTSVHDMQSGHLIESPLRTADTQDIRSFYLEHPQSVTGPHIAPSTFLPRSMIEHLMRSKKSSALGVNFVPNNYSRLDTITNLEGALHTYVTPIVPAYIHGDYAYTAHGHSLLPFTVSQCTAKTSSTAASPSSNFKLARYVLLSALVHPDFEDMNVMMRACSLSDVAFKGREDLPAMISVDAKQDSRLRSAYDFEIKRFLVYHLTSEHALPADEDVMAMSRHETCEYLDSAIKDRATNETFVGRFLTTARGRQAGRVLSLELLINSAYEQVKNELSLLESMAPQGYVYTYDPPSIFAQSLGAEVLVRLHCAALARFAATIASEDGLQKMRVFAFNDYADHAATSLFVTALESSPHVKVMSKSALFPATNGGYYQPTKDLEDSLLVIHNNSDAFGQNIETEPNGLSMDGTLGAGSSAAASLLRTRDDLLDNIVSG